MIVVVAAEATGDEGYRDGADALFQGLQADFDATHGVFKSRANYDADEVAWIVGGLNFLALKGNADIQGDARATLVTFYESVITVAGMQLSAPPGKNGAMAGEWEKNLQSVLYYHPANTPRPPMAGKLPVPAEEVTWNGECWEISSDTFVTGKAMHLANELNWFNPGLGSVQFPSLR